MKMIPKRLSISDLLNAVDHNYVACELLRIKQAKTNKYLRFLTCGVVFTVVSNYCGRIHQNEEIEKLKIRLNDFDDVEGENGM